MSMDRIEELMQAAYEGPPGSTRTNLVEQAVSVADAMEDGSLGYELRMELIESAFFHGQSERALVAFVWCLSYADRNPDDIDPHGLLWKFKWILGVLPRLPQISRTKILEMINDMGRRVEEEGFRQRPVHYMRWKELVTMGDLAAAEPEVELWQRAAKDDLQDCPACEADSEVEYLAARHRDEEALKRAKPILAGKMVCAEVPHLTLGLIVRPLLRLGRLDEAKQHSDRGYKLTAKNDEFIPAVSEHLLLATHTDQLVRGLRMFTRHAPWGLETGMPARRFRFDCVASAFLQKLARAGIPVETEPTISKKTGKPRPPARLLLPADHPCHRNDDQYDPAELAAWYRQEAESLADQFNRRNGNDYFTRWLNETHELAGK